jgi:tight adherence protein C
MPEFPTNDALILFMAGSAVLALSLLVWRGFVYKDPYEARMKSMAQRRAAYKTAALGASPRGQPVKGLVRNLAKKVGKSNAATQQKTSSLRLALARAGIRSVDAPDYFLLAQVVFPFVFGGLAALYIATSSQFNPSAMTAAMIYGGAAGFGYFVPRLFIRNKAIKRRKQLRKQLPDALDLLVVCAEAGLSLSAALDRVVRELARSSGEIADELGLLLIELNFLDERRKAFMNLCERTDMIEFRSLSNTLNQAEKYGTPLSQALRVLGQEYRQDRLTRAEEKAARLPALLTVPMIIFILPTLFIVIIGPAILKTIDAFRKLGW